MGEEKIRYLRIVVNALRGSTTVLQVSEIKILSKDGEFMSWPTETLVTSTIQETSDAESPKKLIDGSIETKFCSTHFSSGAQINIDLKSNILDRKEYTSWQWFTANDSPERDPVSFELLGSVDGIEFIALDSALNATITETRKALAYSGNIGALPEEYIQVEYIQSSGNQYINSGVPGDSDVRVVSEFDLLANSKSTSCIFGAQGTDSMRYVLCSKSDGTFRSDYGTQITTGPAATVGGHYIADKNQNICKLNGDTITSPQATFSGNSNIYLFARSYSSLSPSEINLYLCRIYKANVLTRDYIPCKNAGGEVGLYDLVGQKFYGNAGSGNFIAGPEVIWPSNDAIYVKINDVWKQIDGIKIL